MWTKIRLFLGTINGALGFALLGCVWINLVFDPFITWQWWAAVIGWVIIWFAIKDENHEGFSSI